MWEVIGEGETRKKPLLEYDRYEHTGGLEMKIVIIVILSILSTTAIAEKRNNPFTPEGVSQALTTRQPWNTKGVYQQTLELREREARIRQMELQNRQLQLQIQQMKK